ncbi:glycoside hydrolase family 76 protein [Mucilaginibacter pedocola]|uniref:Hydrolase n=1 Tax=Mucilaginibacter pedocola TaxID=1792845 RepID=A0A1S9P9U4_9SPHI|nr:glycoside hydrolase family 76 protein [Mucilaginibacter pedocola]OOQ57756.1 hydrolase [Mucilaginibacter pedocola]
MNFKNYLRLAFSAAAFSAWFSPCIAQQKNTALVYKQRAEEMYARVWKLYRVPAQKGLFAENYPSNKKDTLNYFQGEGVKEKEVSFLWPFSGVFTATNVLMRLPGLKPKYKPYQDSLIVGVEQYRDTVRKPTGYQAYPVKFEKADRYYDDNGLVGIDYMESYFNTRNPLYLQRAKEVFKFILSGWNDDVGGGVTWLEGHRDQKPACTNGMATLTTLKIYEGSKDKYYLEQGKRFYSWMYNTLRDSTTGIITNDVKMDGKQNRTFWTYNTGSLIEAAVLLYRFTGEKQYLQQAQQLAADSYKYYSGIPHDKNLLLHVDVPWFVTVLFRGYEALYKQDGNYKYLAAIEHDLNYAWENTRDKYGFTTHSWTPKPTEMSKPKWLLDEACIAELYARLAMIKNKQ